LDHIELARASNLPYVYLGYWVPGSDKMGYKRNFSALEIFNNDVWRNIDDVEGISNEMNPMNTLPIAEQVANLSLP